MTTSKGIVIIDKDRGTTLFDGTTGAADGGVDCTSSQISITDKETCEASKLKEQILDTFGGLVQDQSKLIVTTSVQLNDSSTESETNKTLAGPVTDKSSSTSAAGSQNNTSDTESHDTGSSVTRRSQIAGAIKRQSISVTILGGTATEVAKMKVALRPLVDVGRGDVLVVQSAAPADAAEGTAEAPAKAATDADANAQQQDSPTGYPFVTKSSTSPVVWVLMLLIVVGGAAGMLIMWNRNKRLIAEREVLNQEYRNDMSRFGSIAAANPDDLAYEFEQMLAQSPQSGVPSGN